METKSVSEIPVVRSPLGTYLRAVARMNRIASRINSAMVRGTIEDRNKLLNLYIETENIIFELAQRMQREGIAYTNVYIRQ